MSARRTPSRSATPSSASSRMASGSRHVGSESAMSPPTMKVSSSSGASRHAALRRVSTVNDGPGAVGLDARDAEPLVAGDREPHSAHAVLDARVGLDLLVRRLVRPARAARGRARAAASASCAQTRWPTCGGLNVPPRSPTAPGVSARTWPVALDQVLERAQLAQADRAARVQLLRRVADLGAHAELAAVGEARRGVDVDAGGVDAELERPRGRGVAGHDRLGVARSRSALTCSIASSTRVDDLHGEDRARGTPSAQSSSVASASAARSPRQRRACARRRAARRRRRAARAARRGRNARARRRRARAASRPRCRRPGRCDLGVDDDRARAASRSALGVDVDVAVARRRVDHRHLRDRLTAPSSGPRRRAG